MKLLIIFILPLGLMAYELQESKLVELAQKSSPNLDEIQSRLLMSQSNLDKSEDVLGTNLYMGVNHENTKEKAILSFSPVFNNVNQYSVGVKRNFRYGFNVDLNASVDQRSGSSEIGTEFKDIHTTIYTLGVGIDLWKDIFGKTTRKNLENAKLNYELAKHKNEIEKSVFKNSVRSLYWALVANKEKLNISQKLYETALEQAKLSKQRKKNSIADAGEVARYESQVSQRQASLISLKYETEVLKKQLRDFFPELANQDIKVEKYNINEAFSQLMQCTAMINSKKQAPLEFTNYDEISASLKKIQMNQAAIDSTYDDIDITLTASAFKKGIASDGDGTGNFYEGDYQGSINDITDNNRDGFKAGLMVNIPIGKKYQGSEDTIKKYNQLSLKAQQVGMMSKIENTHSQISSSINYLIQVITAQSENTKKLRIQVKDMEKKYSQARIPVHLLIQDQDALLASELRVVDTKLMIANIILDYFNVFNTIPCGFNKAI